jgi:hypothetical protein
LQSENRQGSAIVNAVSVRTGYNRAIAIPTIEVGNKESVNDCVAESVIRNEYCQHGTTGVRSGIQTYTRQHLLRKVKKKELVLWENFMYKTDVAMLRPPTFLFFLCILENGMQIAEGSITNK